MKALPDRCRKLAAVCLRRKVRWAASAALVGVALTAPPGGFANRARRARLLRSERLTAVIER